MLDLLIFLAVFGTSLVISMAALYYSLRNVYEEHYLNQGVDP